MSNESVPDNANQGCVGPTSEQAGKASSCAGCPNQAACASGAAKEVDPAIAHIEDKMSQVKHKLLVLSGKGGVGKSTFSSQLAFTLASQGYQVGLLDVDICGPSVPRMLGLVGHEVHQSASGWSPVYVEHNLAVMSIGFMLPSNDNAVIWRGPRKNGLIKQFLTDVDWGELDYLIIDTPPGTSDEHISLAQLLKSSTVDGAIIVTTPQEVAMADVRKEINFCMKTSIPIIGIVENMHSISVPLTYAENPNATGVRLVNKEGIDKTEEYLKIMREKCPELIDNMCIESCLFAPSTTLDINNEMQQTEDEMNQMLSNSIGCVDNKLENNPRNMAMKFNIPYLGQLPMDRNLMDACENGLCFVENYPNSVGIIPFNNIVSKIVEITK